MSELDNLKSIPPPQPPPPPPPQLPLQTFKPNSKTLSTNVSPQVTENDLDLSIKIILSHGADFTRVFFMRNKYLEPQLQDGPKCGLVALSMATSTSGNFVSVDTIFQTALSLGFTKQGEMFSADSLAVLAEKCCAFRTTVIKGNLNTHLKCILESLLRECLLLVPISFLAKSLERVLNGKEKIQAKIESEWFGTCEKQLNLSVRCHIHRISLKNNSYDADFNHSPCCKRGQKAHWAVISGFLIIEKHKTDSSVKDHRSVVVRPSKCSALCDGSGSDIDLIVSTDGRRLLISKRTAFDNEEEKNNFGEGKVYLIGRQGKSRHFGVWPFDDMADSNDNLVSVSADRSPELYLLPENGLSEGLKGKAIILERPLEEAVS